MMAKDIHGHCKNCGKDRWLNEDNLCNSCLKNGPTRFQIFTNGKRIYDSLHSKEETDLDTQIKESYREYVEATAESVESE